MNELSELQGSESCGHYGMCLRKGESGGAEKGELRAWVFHGWVPGLGYRAAMVEEKGLCEIEEMKGVCFRVNGFLPREGHLSQPRHEGSHSWRHG